MASQSKVIDYLFITEPDDILKCSICFEVARDPKQCEDCGKLFCSECIEKNGRKPCPNCRKQNPRYFNDIRGGREIRALGVRCNNMERGCRWTGTIGTLNNHMSTCQFALVPCPNKCEDDGELTILRKELDKHLKTECLNRAHQCQHCGEKGTYTSITEDHDKVCNKKRVACPNKESGCPLSMERGKIQQHMRSVCDYTEVACAYESLGCAVRMLRKDITKHQKEDNEAHLHIALDLLTVFTAEHKALSEGEAVVFKITEYTSKKRKNEEFYSKPFYTHNGGYKMCINVDVNGSLYGADTHVSVYAKLLEGRYDDQFHWPFMGTVTYELLNQLADDKHHRLVNTLVASDNMQVGKIRGYPNFLPQSSLPYDPATNTQYLLDDTLYFRVSVKVANHKPWLVCTDKINVDTARATKDSKTLKDGERMVFKVNGYKDWKAINATTYSDSFYTGPGGYKMCIGVNPNGHGSSHGTHVSVYAALLEGAYDANLSLPFVGTVTVTLLNQLADNNHHSHHIKCESKDLFGIGKKKGCDTFISHFALTGGPVNPQYLKDDTLYFSVSVTVRNHKSWLKCTHHN